MQRRIFACISECVLKGPEGEHRSSFSIFNKRIMQQNQVDQSSEGWISAIPMLSSVEKGSRSLDGTFQLCSTFQMLVLCIRWKVAFLSQYL